MIVNLRKMQDKFGQQRQGRTDGAIRSTADRRPMGEDRSLAPETAQPSPGWKTSPGRPQSAGRHFVDSAQRRSLAGSDRGIPLTVHLLAAAARLGRARGLAHPLACIPGGTEPTRATRLERIISRLQFCADEKRGSKVGKTKRGKGTKWMVVVDGEGVPLGKQVCSASPNEARLPAETVTSV